MVTISLILALAALVMVLFHAATGKVPLWVPVLLLNLVLLLTMLPIR